MLVRPMVSIHISNWVGSITFFTIESTFYMSWQLVHSYNLLISSSLFVETLNMVP